MLMVVKSLLRAKIKILEFLPHNNISFVTTTCFCLNKNLLSVLLKCNILIFWLYNENDFQAKIPRVIIFRSQRMKRWFFWERPDPYCENSLIFCYYIADRALFSHRDYAHLHWFLTCPSLSRISCFLAQFPFLNHATNWK